MNLYRSFGNLMEAWITEENQCLDPAWLGNTDEDPLTPSSDMGANPRSESVDSGVETSSSVTSFPATPCSVSTDNAEIDTFPPERGATPASTSQSPVLSSPVPSSSSSSSPHLHPSTAQESLHLKVEQALQKTDSKRVEKKPEHLTVDEVLRRRPRSSFVSKRHTLELVRGQRSESFGPRRTVNPLLPVRQMSDMCRRPTSLQLAHTRSEFVQDLGEDERTGLSPGLCYLEQVCQMLEEIARQQMHSRALQMEMDALQEHQDMEVSQALDICQSDFKAAEEDHSSCQMLENTQSAEHSSSETQPKKNHPHRHFRQRSASDTNISKLHLERMNANCRGQHLRTDGLLEEEEEDHKEQESEKEATNKSYRNWKLKFGSLSRVDPAARDTKGQQMQSSERSSARRRLSQLFRWRRKTLPV